MLTKILTLASLQGIADILSGEGIRFDEFEMNFQTKNNLITIDEIYSIGLSEWREYATKCMIEILDNKV